VSAKPTKISYEYLLADPGVFAIWWQMKILFRGFHFEMPKVVFYLFYYLKQRP
jgi:hypothetical protein